MGIVSRKIALVCNYELLPERVGGMDHFFWLFDKKCRENDIQIDWFFPNMASHGGYSKLAIIEAKNQNLETYFLQSCKKNRLAYTHIITHFVELCTPFFYKLKQASNAEIIVVDHNPRPLYGYPFKKRVEKKIKGLLFSRYINLFVGVSNYTVNELWKDFGNHLKSKSIIIYNGVLIEGIKVRTDRNYKKPSFLVVSHLRESKGIQDLIDAVALLPTAIKNELQIAVYGDGPYKEVLLQRTLTKQVEHSFIFMGSKPNLNEIFCQYDYMIQPTHMECFSLSILESLAANVPVITTNVGGNEEAIADGENGFIYVVKKSRSLSEILINVYLGDQKISTNTRGLIEDSFSLEKMVHNHFNLIQ
ncbi:glycosyltransferase family 4 protein [Flavobacterium sp. ACAM 123]|uniref:glycosyltransferase family 4 protein n=1 Tax=Flavobacterium sp. ACAM 123 TaxID=1189620 RepID=UPI0004974D14|nr:glycosyltransferase family 4 protein [Flavobacterium sp. ACAM 123]